jgi:tRNA(Ile2) C34 agmatinyltransferase TiaS
MNEYQKALGKLANIIIYEEEGYQEDIVATYPEEVELLQKLIDKETLMKPKKEKLLNIFNQPDYFCPKCNNELGKSQNRCEECGQKIDWSE